MAPSEVLLLTPVEAARRLSVSRSALYELLACHEIKSVKIGRSRRILAASLADFVNRLPEEELPREGTDGA